MSDNTTNLTHIEAAQAMIEKIRAMRQEIPNFVIPTSKADARKMARAASVPPQFVEMSAAATKNSPPLARSGGPDPDTVRDLLNYGEAYAVVAAELDALSAFVHHSVANAKSIAGRYALTTYALAQRLAAAPETAELAPIASALRHALGRRKAKAQPATQEPTPTPTPTEPTPTTN